MAAILLTYVIVERLLELVIARRNTQRLLARGAREVGASHYPFMVGLHVAWLASILVWVALTSPAINLPFLALYVVLQGLRVWVMASLGAYWTTRIITLADAPLIKRGPYRFMRHPNYVVVVLEIVTLPMMFGAWLIAVIFSLLNVAMLWVRIRAENDTIGARH
jgi:methyltransferase